MLDERKAPFYGSCDPELNCTICCRDLIRTNIGVFYITIVIRSPLSQMSATSRTEDEILNSFLEVSGSNLNQCRVSRYMFSWFPSISRGNNELNSDHEPMVTICTNPPN